MQSPEELARENIDALLTRCGWIIQRLQTTQSVAQAVASRLREVPLKRGRCDYLLLVDRQSHRNGRSKESGFTLSSVAEQSGRYAKDLPDILARIWPEHFLSLRIDWRRNILSQIERDPHPTFATVIRFPPTRNIGEVDRRTRHSFRHRLAEMPSRHP